MSDVETTTARIEVAAPAHAPRAEVGNFELRYALGAAAGELALALLPGMAGAPFAVALGLHFVLISVLSAVLYRRRSTDADLSAPLITLIATSTAGPIGAVLSLVALVWLARPAQPSALLQAWYDRIALSTTVDPETQLSDRVASGRILDTQAPPPQALVATIRNGTLAERQAALGLIARFFHMNYLAALADALRSEVPVIRVQAAAVASRIRPRLAQEVERRMIAAADVLRDRPGSDAAHRSDVALCLHLIRELDQAIASGLLDGPRAKAAAAMAARLSATVDCRALSLVTQEPLKAHARLDAFERHLLAAREFARLRVLRRRRRIAGRGLPLARFAPMPAAAPRTVRCAIAHAPKAGP